MKRGRRHNKYAKEKLECREQIKKMEAKNGGGSLEQQIMKRQQERASASGSFFDRLLEKYGDVDDSDEFDFAATSKKKSTKKKATKKVGTKEAKNAEHKVKNGRVTKTRSSV